MKGLGVMERRKRRRRLERSARLRKIIASQIDEAEESEAGKASDYIHQFKELRPSDRVLICIRISGDEPKRDMPLVKRWLRRQIKEVGAIPVRREAVRARRHGERSRVGWRRRRIGEKLKADYLLA
jgi:hypothetical protein